MFLEIESYLSKNKPDYFFMCAAVSDFKIKYISTSPGIIDDLFASFNSFLNSTYSLFGFIESIDIQRLVSKKKIETNLICLVCPELR